MVTFAKDRHFETEAQVRGRSGSPEICRALRSESEGYPRCARKYCRPRGPAVIERRYNYASVTSMS